MSYSGYLIKLGGSGGTTLPMKYIKVDAIDALKSYIGDASKTDDLLAELNQLAIETNYLYTKIEKICV